MTSPREIDREVLRLSVPSILANITIPLVGMADIAIASRLGDSASLIGGIAIGTMLFDLLYWVFGFLRTGTGGLTAQAYGRRAAGSGGTFELEDILSRSVAIAMLSGALLIALQWAVLWFAFGVVECSPAVRSLATEYFKIRIWAAPASLSIFAFKGWFIGMQDTVRPMIMDLIINLGNIVLSIAFAFGIGPLPALGFAGVAAGTVAAQWSGFVYAAIARRIRYPFRGYRAIDALNAVRSTPKEFFTLNSGLIVRSLGLIAVYVGYTIISARYGDTLLAACTVVMKLLLFFSYFTDGFAFAGEALTGRFTGMKDPAGVRLSVRRTFLWSSVVALFFISVYGLGGEPIIRLLAKDQTVVDAARGLIPWMVLMPLIGAPAFVWDGVYTGATAVRELRWSGVLCAIAFFAVWISGVLFSSTGLPSVHVLMGAYFAHLLIRAVYLTARYPKIFAIFASK
ncbi:MAG: MATE family efflux transporter [Bacteroidales bacterium]|nr:MATE family efflux transporter [Bacteroidales bacterium]